MKKFTLAAASFAAMLASPAAFGDTIDINFQSNAQLASWVDGVGPFFIDDYAGETADGVAFTFDMTLTGTGGTPAGNIGFSQNRPRMDFDAADSDIKGLTLTISDVQGIGGTVTFDGFLTVDRFDNSGGDPWDVNGETISAVGNSVALAALVPGSLLITQLANTAGNSNGATRLEGFEAQFTGVPEPSSLALVGLGIGMLSRRRRK